MRSNLDEDSKESSITTDSKEEIKSLQNTSKLLQANLPKEYFGKEPDSLFSRIYFWYFVMSFHGR